MQGRRRAAGLVLAGAALLGALLVTTGAGAAPHQDGQPATAPDWYEPAWRGWMTGSNFDYVHDLAQIGDTVYVAGTFTTVRPAPGAPTARRTRLAAFDARTGDLRGGFAPDLDGTVFSLEPAPDGSRLYIGGNFRNLNGVARLRLAALDPVSGATVPGLPGVGGGAIRSIHLRGDTLFLGGNFSSVAGQARSRLAAVDVTSGALLDWGPSAQGGAVLTLEESVDGARLYVGGRFTGVDDAPASSYLVALDPATGAQDPTFGAQPGREVFDLLADERGWLWSGLGGIRGRLDVYRGDGSLLTRHETAGDVQAVEQVGGLIYVGGHQFGPTEADNLGIVDPAAPAIMDVTSFPEPSEGGDGVWAIHSTGRDLWLGGRPDRPWAGFTRHRAAPPRAPRVELVPTLATWSYLDRSAAGAGWAQPGFDDSTWSTGAAEAGFGDGGEATVVTPGRVTYYFRHHFEVSGRDSLADLRLDLLADDGAVVHVNGVEVARANLPAGPVGDATLATTARFGNAEDLFLSYPVPREVLVEGPNVVAVEVHQNGASSNDLSFDARLSAVRDETAPSAPTGLVATGTTRTSVDLRWQRSRDPVGDTGYAAPVDDYEVLVDGVPVAAARGWATTVAGLTPATTHTVAVRAVDLAGNRSAPSSPVVVTTPLGPVDIVDMGSTWRYHVGPTEPSAGWWAPDGDDSAWTVGPAPLGRRQGDLATVLAPGDGTAWFRHTFSVDGAAGAASVFVDLVADDGAVVYLNGVEVIRDNLPGGTLSATTRTPKYRTGSAERTVRTFAVPPSALREGRNVLAVAVHQGAGSPDARFDLRLRAL